MVVSCRASAPCSSLLGSPQATGAWYPAVVVAAEIQAMGDAHRDRAASGLSIARVPSATNLTWAAKSTSSS